MVKFLIIRFSSIGDIVLTTPIIRGLKNQVENAEVHYLTKPQFAGILDKNPNIDKLLILKEKLNDTIEEIKGENYDYIIDLHHNLRTSVIKRKTGITPFSFNKLNLHIVDRYFDTVGVFDVNPDGKGLDYYITDNVNPEDMHAAFKGQYMVVVVGANHFTKQIPVSKIVSIANKTGIPVCLVGGNDVKQQSGEIEAALKIPFLNTVGKISLNQSASLIKQCHVVLTPDTGMMHIAAAFNKNIISLWGNTVPQFGMYPYKAGGKSKIFEVKDLKCRPCSKIGYEKCPKKHFNCMNNIDDAQIVQYIQGLIEKVE